MKLGQKKRKLCNPIKVLYSLFSKERNSLFIEEKM